MKEVDFSLLSPPEQWIEDVGAIQTDPYDEKYDWFHARGPIIKNTPPDEGRRRAANDARYAALLVRAAQIMKQHEWFPVPQGGRWYAGWFPDGVDSVSVPVMKVPGLITFDDPHVAIVKADEWCKQNKVEAAQKQGA